MKKVVVFVNFFLPGYKSGGPIRTIENTISNLGSQLDFCVVCADRDATDNAAYPNVLPGQWNVVNGIDVFYVRPGIWAFIDLLKCYFIKADIFYINSFFSPFYSILPLFFAKAQRKKVVLAPRGEFAVNARKIRSFRKKIYLLLFKALFLQFAVRWQASSRHEADDIRSIFSWGDIDLVVVSNLPGIQSLKFEPAEARLSIDGRQQLKICFLSRISKMKNLDYALKVLAKCQGNVQFDIYGPVREASYWKECERIIKTLPGNISVEYKGSVEHQYVSSTISAYDLFFLPTLGENYGHAIVEALFAGVPVLISDRTPWNELVSSGAGWDLPLSNPLYFKESIEKFLNMGIEDKRKMKIAARSYIESRLDLPKLIDDNLSMFS